MEGEERQKRTERKKEDRTDERGWCVCVCVRKSESNNSFEKQPCRKEREVGLGETRWDQYRVGGRWGQRGMNANTNEDKVCTGVGV